ncbi:hypothetical protein [Thioclava sp. ES.031]|uniref:hypothetical protein n=1 Tax=Thioclava sp. ES.031 TaxID=1798203 RepID=UPI0011460F5C|nr:hypothetical protein [Thioclava sp. ES.031]
MKDLIVFTGDIVGSSRLTASELSAALDAIEGAAAVLRPALGETAFARNRGDGWQIAITQPRLQARLALLIRAKLRALGGAFSTRIAMAEGDGTLPADGNLNGASGAVFTASGQLLDSLEGPRIAHAAGGRLARHCDCSITSRKTGPRHRHARSRQCCAPIRRPRPPPPVKSGLPDNRLHKPWQVRPIPPSWKR